MDPRLDRIAILKNSFPGHPSVQDFGVELETLEMHDDGSSKAIVRTVAKKKFMVNCDMEPGLICQGGISFAVANFAGVYAAMVHTDGHTPLHTVNCIRYWAPIREGQEISACAKAVLIDEYMIDVTFSIVDSQGELKLSGTAFYRTGKRKK